MIWSVGIDLGGTNIGAALVKDCHEMVSRTFDKTMVPRSPQSLAGTMAACVQRLLDQEGLQVTDLAAIGIGLPGLVDPQEGKLVFASNLALQDVHFPSLMAPYFPGIPVQVNNDADCAALGEYLVGGANAYDSLLLLTLGTGLGGGFIDKGRIFRGGDGRGIEPGHMTLVAQDGWPCTCGQEGCFEAYVSIRGLKRLVSQLLDQGLPSILRDWFQEEEASFNVRRVFDAAGEGDLVAQEAVQQYIRYLALGIRSLVVLYRPQIILLGGGVSGAGDRLRLPLEEAVRQTTFAGDLLPPPPIRISRLGNDAGILGAALLHQQA